MKFLRNTRGQHVGMDSSKSGLAGHRTLTLGLVLREKNALEIVLKIKKRMD